MSNWIKELVLDYINAKKELFIAHEEEFQMKDEDDGDIVVDLGDE